MQVEFHFFLILRSSNRMAYTVFVENFRPTCQVAAKYKVRLYVDLPDL
mgnify:CR=1 FL=1